MSRIVNDLCFRGEIVHLCEMKDHEVFGGSMTLKGQAQRVNSKPRMCKLGFLVPFAQWDIIKKKYDIGAEIEVSGHFEYWNYYNSAGKLKEKTVHIVDLVF